MFEKLLTLKETRAFRRRTGSPLVLSYAVSAIEYGEPGELSHTKSA